MVIYLWQRGGVIVKKILSKIFLVISFIPIVLIIINIIKSYFWGYEVIMMMGLDIPLSYGFEAVYNYLWVVFSFTCFGIITLPIIFICFIYQIIYFVNKNKNKNTNVKYNN